MGKKIIGDGIEPKCIYCKFGILTPDKSAVLCPKKGVLDISFNCKKFIYDPLKRVPAAPPLVDTFKPEDFEI